MRSRKNSFPPIVGRLLRTLSETASSSKIPTMTTSSTCRKCCVSTTRVAAAAVTKARTLAVYPTTARWSIISQAQHHQQEQQRGLNHLDHHKDKDIPSSNNKNNHHNSNSQDLPFTNTTTDSPTTLPPPPSQRSSASRRNKRRGQQQEKRILDSHNINNIPSYKEFVHRFTVLTMYRNYFRTIRSAVSAAAAQHNHGQWKELTELKSQVRREFKLQQHHNTQDTFYIQRSIAEGKKRLQELQTYIGHPTGYQPSSSLLEESWMNTPNDPAEDQRGRVGQGWPWQK
jgi:hypothetical protein